MGIKNKRRKTNKKRARTLRKTRKKIRRKIKRNTRSKKGKMRVENKREKTIAILLYLKKLNNGKGGYFKFIINYRTGYLKREIAKSSKKATSHPISENFDIYDCLTNGLENDMEYDEIKGKCKKIDRVEELVDKGRYVIVPHGVDKDINVILEINKKINIKDDIDDTEVLKHILSELDLEEGINIVINKQTGEEVGIRDLEDGGNYIIRIV